MSPRANLRIFILQKRSLVDTLKLMSILGPKSWKVKGKEGSAPVFCARKRHGKQGPREGLRVARARPRSPGAVSLESQSSGSRRAHFGASPGRFRPVGGRESIDARDPISAMENDPAPGRPGRLRSVVFRDVDRDGGLDDSAGPGRRNREARHA